MLYTCTETILLVLAAIVLTVWTECVDQHELCTSWESLGECVLNPAYMMCHCPQSCNTNSMCAGVNATDQTCQCALYAANGQCPFMASICPYTCDRHEAITCDPPTSYPHAIATGNRRYLDRVVYLCRYGYRNDGNIGLRVCQETGTWKTIQGENGLPPVCVPDEKPQLPCQEPMLAFSLVQEPVISSLSILESTVNNNVAECADRCLRKHGCTHFTYSMTLCSLYYDVVINVYNTPSGDMWEKKITIQSLYPSLV
ncbi:uncharacterized protein [Haliotis cracherodii]|uniref:uncharacterized protein n=1 Tax=Haliotis cracherodii TaxID=6455 RepID=UPI0039ECB0C6